MVLSQIKSQPVDKEFLGLQVSTFFLKFLVNFAEHIFMTKVCFFFLPYTLCLYKYQLGSHLVTSCVYPRLRKFHRLFFVKDFIDIVTIMLYQKNSEIFLR